MVESDDFFNELEHHLKSDLPFVSYRKPNTVEVKAMLQMDDELHKVSDYNESGFVFAPFDDKEDAVLIPSHNSEFLNYYPEIISSVNEKSHKENSSNDSSKESHINLVKKGIDTIHSGLLKKVVLSRIETLQLSDSNPIQLFKRLLQTYQTAFVYCWYHPKVGLWLGATPETLLKVEGNRFDTMALAGTQLYNGTLDAIWQNKEKQEQQFVTDFVVDNLKDIVESLKVSKTKTVRAGSILHLLTEINGTLNFKLFNLKQVIQSLHPTPAICGIPRESAKEFILENENYNREFYTGFLGELNLQEKITRNSNRKNVENSAYASVKKVSNLFVNLRCMQLKQKQAIIYIGGGITKDSVPENEWIETVNKTNTIKKVLS